MSRHGRYCMLDCTVKLYAAIFMDELYFKSHIMFLCCSTNDLKNQHIFEKQITCGDVDAFYIDTSTRLNQIKRIIEKDYPSERNGF